MIIHDCIQYEPDWWALKSGVPSSSEFNRIITPARGELSKQAVQYLCELIAEPITGEDESAFNESEWVIRGRELESEALDWLAFARGIESTKVGFITNDDETVGCSPDAMKANGKGYDYGIEIKCPKGSTHVGYLLKGALPDFYKPQVHGSMYITGLPWKFMSYHPRFDPLVVNVKPDEYTEKVGKAIEIFVADLVRARKKVLQ